MSQTFENQAAWLAAKSSRLVVGSAEMPVPGPGEVVIRNHAVAVNPIDWKIQDLGLMVQRWPALMGGDIAGEVVRVGKGVHAFKEGDRVMAHVFSFGASDMQQADVTGENRPQNDQYAAFQLYTRAPVTTTALIPDPVSYADACVLPLCFDTAVVGLCSDKGQGFFGLPFPSLDPEPNGKVIVVWGGSSAVGASVTQVAVATGTRVIATASKHNFGFCKACGATAVFDYKSDSIISDVAEAVKQSGLELAGVFDSVSIHDQSMQPCLDILQRLGGGNMAAVLPVSIDKPANVTVGQVLGWSPITHDSWRSYVAAALEAGKLQCMPPPLVVGRGLEAIQTGLDVSRKGVSAKKVVIEL